MGIEDADEQVYYQNKNNLKKEIKFLLSCDCYFSIYWRIN
jgi:hypothetical protein